MDPNSTGLFSFPSAKPKCTVPATSLETVIWMTPAPSELTEVAEMSSSVCHCGRTTSVDPSAMLPDATI